MNTHDSEMIASSEGFLQRLFGLFFRSSDPEREKRRLLKEIARSLRRLKTRCYHPKGKLAEPGLAKFFFDIYKTVGPAQVLLSGAETSKVLKTILIENSLTDEQLGLKDKLSEESIRERVDQIEPKLLIQKLKDELKRFFSFFDINKINGINNQYKLISALLSLIKFDYYFFLKKFDSRLPENNFNYNPRFEPISGQYIVDELKDFLEILPSVDPGAKWDHIMEVIKTYRSVEIIAQDSLKKLLQNIRQVRNTHELEMIVQLIDEDPFYRPDIRAQKENIVEAYLSKLKMNTELTMQKIAEERKKNRMGVLATRVFGTASISRLQHYTEKANISFSKKMLGGYTHVAPLNYLKAFLLDYVKKDVRQLVDLLIITGKWTDNAPSQMLSESFHQLLKISDEIMKFDEALAEDGEYGKRVQTAIYKADKDKLMMNNLRQLIKKINELAQNMIVKAGQHCINLANVLKLALEDYTKEHPNLIINWRELEGQTEKNLKATFIAVYKQLYYFVQLLKFFA